jgi:DNA-binding CsgD family transcriptional regulator
MEMEERPMAMEHSAEQSDHRGMLSVIDGLRAHVAILGFDGTILLVNRSWRAFAGANSATLVNEGVGLNYLEICDRAQPPSDEGAAETAEGIRSLLAHDADYFEYFYPCHSPNEERWFKLRASRLDHDVARVLLLHMNLTDQYRARMRMRSRFRTLSVRETEVLRLVVAGRSSRQIASDLNISANTVENHRHLVMSKTRAENTADLVRMAVIAEVIDVGGEDNEYGAD